MANTAPSFATAGTGQVVTDVAGTRDSATAVAAWADGASVAGGFSTRDPALPSELLLALVRYRPDGSVDTAFGSDGRVLYDAPGEADSVQALALPSDGGVLVLGTTTPPAGRIVQVLRLDATGAPDAAFGGGDGVADVDLGGANDAPAAMLLQPDGRILVAGSARNATFTMADIAVARLGTDGAPDTGFGGGDGLVTTSLVIGEDFASGMALQSDGRILVTGTSQRSVVLLRYDSDGALDASFGGGDGIVLTDVTADANDGAGRAVAVDSVGRILVAGEHWDGGTSRGFLVRYQSDGSVDASFGTAGLLTLAGTRSSSTLHVLDDGDLLVGGTLASSPVRQYVMRLDASGSPDTAFGGGDGLADTAAGALGKFDLDGDGRIVMVANATRSDIDNASDTGLLRFTSDGRIDPDFGATNTLDSAPVFDVGQPPVALDADVQVRDAELDAAGSYDGATLALARRGGAAPDDVFSARPGGPLAALSEGGDLVLDGTAVGTVAQNSAGTLRLAFGPQATPARVDAVLQHLAYAHVGSEPPAAVTVDWTFSDGNTGAQGQGGARSATGSTIVTIVRDSTAPDVPSILSVVDDVGAVQGPIAPGGASDDRTPTLSGHAEPGATVRVFAAGDEVARTTADGNGAWSVATAPLAPGQPSLSARALDGSGNESASSGAFAFWLINVVAGTPGPERIDGIDGLDLVSADAGDDTLGGAAGNDTLFGNEGDDHIEGGPGDDGIAGGDGVDVAAFAAPRADVAIALNAGPSGSGSAASAALGGDTFTGIERLKFADAVIAIDTRSPGEHAFDVVALLHCAFGALPPQAELARFLPLADAGADAAAVGDAIIAHYVPGGLPTEALVAFLFFQLTGAQAPADVVAAFAATVGPGQPFPTQGALFAAASTLEIHTVRFAGLVADGVELPADWYAD